jgi:hypothetical protein
VVTAANQPGIRQTVEIRQGLGNGESYPIRISTLLEKYVLVGPVGQSFHTQGGQLSFFDNADGQITQITVAPEDKERLDPKSLYQWAGSSSCKKTVGQAAIENVVASPETAMVAIATHRGLEHERRNVFHHALETHSGRQQAPAIIAAVKIENDAPPTGLCLDELPEVDGSFVDLSGISLGLSIDLSWESMDGELDDLQDKHDFF